MIGRLEVPRWVSIIVSLSERPKSMIELSRDTHTNKTHVCMVLRMLRLNGYIVRTKDGIKAHGNSVNHKLTDKGLAILNPCKVIIEVTKDDFAV